MYSSTVGGSSPARRPIEEESSTDRPKASVTCPRVEPNRQPEREFVQSTHEGWRREFGIECVGDTYGEEIIVMCGNQERLLDSQLRRGKYVAIGEFKVSTKDVEYALG